MYNQHILRGMATNRHRSLVQRGGRKALLETLNKHQKKKTPIFTNLKKNPNGWWIWVVWGGG